MCLHYYHVGVYNETAEQIDTIDLTRTTGNDVNVISHKLQHGNSVNT
jgi:hypothetical protein